MCVFKMHVHCTSANQKLRVSRIFTSFLWKNFWSKVFHSDNKFIVHCKNSSGINSEAVSRGVQGGGATLLSKSGGCEGPTCASHLCFPPPWLIIRGVHDIWPFWQQNYMICFKIVIYVWFLTPLLLLVIKFLFIFKIVIVYTEVALTHRQER